MNEAQVLQFLSSTALGEFTRTAAWAFPAFETLHFIGLCTLFGSLMVVDLRVLGLGRDVPIAATLPFIRFAILGLALNVVSGVAFFCSDPFNYWGNPAFRWKMALVAFGALNALAFELFSRRQLAALPPDTDAGIAAKAIASLSLTTWIAVIVLGRLLPYVGAGNG